MLPLGPSEISRDAQEIVDLLNRPVTRAMTRRIAAEAKRKVVLFKRSFHRLAYYKFEDKEDILVHSKTLLVFIVQENNKEIKLSWREGGK